MSNRQTDYIFDPVKFSSFDGKTGPYILYTSVRLKSILNKSEATNYQITTINNQEMKIFSKNLRNFQCFKQKFSRQKFKLYN